MTLLLGKAAAKAAAKKPAAAAAAAAVAAAAAGTEHTFDTGRGGVDNKHSTDDESPPPRVCISVHPEGKACCDLNRLRGHPS